MSLYLSIKTGRPISETSDSNITSSNSYQLQNTLLASLKKYKNVCSGCVEDIFDRNTEPVQMDMVNCIADDLMSNYRDWMLAKEAEWAVNRLFNSETVDSTILIKVFSFLLIVLHNQAHTGESQYATAKLMYWNRFLTSLPSGPVTLS